MSAFEVDTAAIEQVSASIAADGYAIVPGFLPATLVTALAAEARRHDAAGKFRAAGVGRGERRVERSDIRGDRIRWLDKAEQAPSERALWNTLEALRVELNRITLLGLFAFEGHYAIYPPGAFYRRHRDRFRDDDARVLSCALYLNEMWNAEDGGALRLYLSDAEIRDVSPVGSTLVCFLADRCEHEVLPATRERLSITGWFKRRSPG
jgi:SM-20-related protein